MKKVLTVFLSIVLILAMMPSMAFATDGELYCFYANGLTVKDGYLASNDDFAPITDPSIVVGREETFYFAIKVGEQYKVVNQVSCSNSNSASVELRPAGEATAANKPFFLYISEVGSYELSYTDESNSKTYKLTMKCELPEVGCYLDYTKLDDTYLKNDVFDCRGKTCENNKYSFYVVSRLTDRNIESVSYELDESEQREDISNHLEFTKVTGNSKAMLVTVDNSIFTEDNQELCGTMVVKYNTGSDSEFSFYIYGPNYNSDTEYDDTALYGFYAYGLAVDDSGYLTVDTEKAEFKKVEDARMADPSVVVGREETLYFAVWENGRFRVVSPDYENENVIYTENANKSYEVSISKLGAYVLSYAVGDNTYNLTINCELPYVGCYSTEIASEQTYIDNVFEWSEANNSFYIVASSNACNITSARFVKDNDESETEDEASVKIDSVEGKAYIKKVTVDSSVFTDESQKVCGEIVVEYTEDGIYSEGSYSAFNFFIEKAKPIKFYSDVNCEEELDNFSVNTSLAPENNYFYIKSTKGEPAISKITTYYAENKEIVKINDETGDEIHSTEVVEYTGVLDCTKDDAKEVYYKSWDNGSKIAYEPKEEQKSLVSPKEFVEIVEENADKGIWKVQFKANGGKAYRGHENMTFEFAATGTETNKIDIDYGVNLSYTDAHFKQIIPSHEYFGYVLGNAEEESWITKIDNKPYWGGLGGATSSNSDRCGSELWLAMDTTDGYRITDIRNAKGGSDGSSLPYTIEAEYYYKVYDKNNQEISVDNADYWGSISSNGESAFYATQYVGSSNYSGTFEVGFEDVTEFKAFCKEKSYTATLIGSALVYTIFIPVDEQCEVQIVTDAVEASDTVTTAQGIENFTATKQDATSEMQTNLNNYYKPGKEIAGVYELGLKAPGEGEPTLLDGTVDVIIPVEGNPSDYEIVWFNEVNSEDGKTITPVPVVTRYIEGAVMFTTGHFSTYALVKNKTNTPSGGGAVIAPSIEKDDVAAITDSTTSKTTITTTISDTKTETTKDENGNDVSKKTAKVSDDIANELVDQAVANKADTVEINVRSDSGNKVDSGDNVELEISKSAIKGISEKTDANLVINTDNGKVVLDSKTLETIAAETEGDTVKIIVNENTKLSEEQKSASDALGDNGHLVELVIVVGNKSLHDFEGGKVTVTMPVPKKLKDKKTSLIYINDNGICELIDHVTQQIGTDSYISFTTTHFSTFAIVESAAAERIIAQQNQDKANDLIKEAKLKASTAKNSKKNVKITAKADKSLIDELKDMGYTVKYRYYRSTNKASKYTALKTKDTNTYINTKGKKGSRYYYKAQVRVYDSNGELIAKTALKQCSYGTRVWSK